MTSTFLMLLLYSISLNTQKIPFVPPTYNYTNTHYNAGNQNWAVDQGADGIIYIANNDGLLTFDGVNWELLTLPNNLGVKSILADNSNGTERIYIGSFEEFGYFEKNAKNI